MSKNDKMNIVITVVIVGIFLPLFGVKSCEHQSLPHDYQYSGYAH